MIRILWRLSATSSPPPLAEASKQNALWLSRRSYCSASKIIELSALNCEIFRDRKRCLATSNLLGCPQCLHRMIRNLSEAIFYMTDFTWKAGCGCASPSSPKRRRSSPPWSSSSPPAAPLKIGKWERSPLLGGQLHLVPCTVPWKLFGPSHFSLSRSKGLS